MTATYPKDPEKVAKLTEEQYRVTQERATEPAFHNEFWDNEDAGITSYRLGRASVRLDHEVRQRMWVAQLHRTN